MPRDSHSDDLRDPRPPHVSDRRTAQIVELELGSPGSYTGRLPGTPKFLDWLPYPIEHPQASVRLLLRPIEPIAHVPRQNRHGPRVSALGFVRLQRHEPLLEINLLPALCEKFAETHAGEIGCHKQRLEVVG
jgi:hypothetical protein